MVINQSALVFVFPIYNPPFITSLFCISSFFCHPVLSSHLAGRCAKMTDSTGNSPIIRPEGFDILYEEGPCLVVVKPGGVATQAPPGIDSLEVRVKEFLRVRDSKAGNVYLGVPHRLDRPVSGVMVLARHVRAARRLSDQFEARTVRKTYWAVVEGREHQLS